MTHKYHLNNIKCGGCAHSVEQKILSVYPKASPKIDVESGEVSFEAPSQEIAQSILNALAKLGYTKYNPTLLQTAKSYVSCMIGKVTKNF